MFNEFARLFYAFWNMKVWTNHYTYYKAIPGGYTQVCVSEWMEVHHIVYLILLSGMAFILVCLFAGLVAIACLELYKWFYKWDSKY